MTTKIKIAVLCGGRSSEREVSLASGKEVSRNLNQAKYDVNIIEVPKEGFDWFNDLVTLSPDVVFIAMHGPFGEDGRLQGMLEYADLKYTGPGVLASALGMDKLMFRKVMESEKILIPKYTSVRKGETYNLNFEGPFFVKPNSQGSSVGASIANDNNELTSSLNKAFEYEEVALVDEYIKGTEVTCGILGNSTLEVLPLVEILPKNNFFDYESKYTTGGASEISPARVSESLTKEIQKIAVRVYRLVGARGFSRIDFILKDGKTPYVLEINTIPGMTTESLLPKAAKAGGITFPELLDKIIVYAKEN